MTRKTRLPFLFRLLFAPVSRAADAGLFAGALSSPANTGEAILLCGAGVGPTALSIHYQEEACQSRT